MRFLLTTTAVLALANPALSGNLTFEPETEPPITVTPDEPMGGSNASWVIPLIAIGVIGLAIASSGDDDDDGKPDPKPEPEPDPDPCDGAMLDTFEPYQVATGSHTPPPPPDPCK